MNKVWSLKHADGRLSVQAPVSSQPVRFQDAFRTLMEISWLLKREDVRLSVQNVESKWKFAHKHALCTLKRSSSSSEDKVPRGSF